MFRWFKRWQEKILDKLAVKVVDRIEHLYEIHRPAERVTNFDYFEWPNRHVTFKLKDLAHIKMSNPRKRPKKKRNAH
jgi:hypothetical protein